MFYIAIEIDILTYLVISVGATNSCSTNLEIATLFYFVNRKVTISNIFSIFVLRVEESFFCIHN